MSSLEWKDEYCVGVSFLDEQHKNMFGIINELGEALDEGEGFLLVPVVLKKMESYTFFHFASEEKILQETSYPDYARQVNEHEEFVKTLKKYTDDLRDQKMGLSKDVMSFLEEWWTRHIQVEDKKYTEFLNEKGYH